MLKKYTKVQSSILYSELVPLTGDVTCSEFQIDGEIKVVSFCLTHTHTHSYMEYLFLRVHTQFSLLILSEFKQINLFHLKSSENHRLTLIFLETPTKTSAAGSFFWLTSRLKTPLTNKSTKAILLGLLRNCSEQLLFKTHVNNFF